MRPRKKVLLLDRNPDKLSLRGFLLDLKGFGVLPAATAAEALGILEGFAPLGLDVLVAALPCAGMEDGRLLRAVRDRHPELPMLILVRVPNPAHALASRTLSDKQASAAELIDVVKTLAARKRGPRKQPPMPPAAVPVKECAA